VIERLLAAQDALDKGMLDTAGRLFDQVAQADPRNAIAIVGLARVALREDRFDEARELAEQALALDPDEAAAQRLLREVHGEVAVALPLPVVERPTEAVAALAAAQRRMLETEPPVAREPKVPLLARLRRWLFGRRG
jgi:thioredoxin-like negative regulator of GroEL